MSKQRYVVECVSKDTGATEFRTFVARNPVEATSHAQLMGFIVGRVELAPGEVEPAAAKAPQPRRKARPVVLLVLLVGGLAIGSGVLFGVQGYIRNVEGGLPPPSDMPRLSGGERAAEPVAPAVQGTRSSGDKPAAPALAEDPVPKIDLGGSITLGNSHITVHKVLLAPLAGERYSEGRPPTSASTGPKLVLAFSVRNDSPGQLYRPLDALVAIAGSVKDDLGRTLKAYVADTQPPNVAWDGQSFSDLRPGEQTTNVVFAEAPADRSATVFTWRLYVRGSNSEQGPWLRPSGGRVVDVRFAAAQIEELAAAPDLSIVRSSGGGRAALAPFAKRMADVGGTLEFDGARVRVLGVRHVNELRCTRPGPDGAPQPRVISRPYLVLDLEIQSTADVRFRPMQAPAARWSFVTDQFGNLLEPLWFRADDPLRLDGQDLRELGPGESMRTFLAVQEPKIDSPGRCVWTVRLVGPSEPGDGSGEPEGRSLGYVRFGPADIAPG